MTRRTLIIIHRGPEYQQDFDDIALKVNALDPQITIYHLPASLRAAIPEAAWSVPSLTVSLVPAFRVEIKRGPILKNWPIPKLAQQRILLDHGLPTPPAQPFSFGMKLDPIMFGGYVLLKPMNLDLTSKGDGVHVMRRQRAEQMTPLRFSPDHPIRNGETFIVQKFINTGTMARTYRVTTFLGQVLYCATYTSNTSSPDLSSADDAIETGNFTQKGDRTIALEVHQDTVDLARKVAAAFSDIPLLGIDIVRDVRTSRLYVLEINGGGNTWHFSSEMWAERRAADPDLAGRMKAQLSAFDVAARALAETARAMAR